MHLRLTQVFLILTFVLLVKGYIVNGLKF